MRLKLKRQLQRCGAQSYSQIVSRAEREAISGKAMLPGYAAYRVQGRQGVPVKMQMVPAPPVRQRSSVFCARAQFA